VRVCMFVCLPACFLCALVRLYFCVIHVHIQHTMCVCGSIECVCYICFLYVHIILLLYIEEWILLFRSDVKPLHTHTHRCTGVSSLVPVQYGPRLIASPFHSTVTYNMLNCPDCNYKLLALKCLTFLKGPAGYLRCTGDSRLLASQ